MNDEQRQLENASEDASADASGGEDDGAAPKERPFRWVEKDVMRGAQGVAAALLKVPRADWGALPLDEQILNILDEHARITRRAHVARKRLKDRLATRIRRADLDAIREGLAALSAAEDAAKGMTGWRTRLLSGGEEALGAFLEAFPAADRQRLRQLVRQARKEGALETETRGARRLLAALEEIAT